MSFTGLFYFLIILFIVVAMSDLVHNVESIFHLGKLVTAA